MIIYKIINTVNGKVYIGQTVQTIKRRWANHCRAEKETYIKAAINKHGQENFTIEEIDRAATLDELNQKEIYWIEFYNSRDRTIGYNLKEGGDSSPCHEETKIKIGMANSNKSPSLETRAKQSAAKKGKPLSDETKRRMSETRKGHEVSEETRVKLREKRKNYTQSEQTRLKMSEARKGKSYMTPEKYKEIGEKKKGVKRPDVSERLRNTKPSPESIAKRVEKVTGRKNSEEVKQKMRDNFKGGRTGQKNKPESIAKMLATKARKKAEKEQVKEVPLRKVECSVHGCWSIGGPSCPICLQNYREDYLLFLKKQGI